MPAKEIKELRQSGRLEEALAMAMDELNEATGSSTQIDNFDGLPVLRDLYIKSRLIWPKRNVSWVYYEFLKENSSAEHFEVFLSWLQKLMDLQLPAEEILLFEQLSWQVGKLAFNLAKAEQVDSHKGIQLFEAIESIPFPKPSESFSFLFKALHKLLKDTDKYIEFADWWDFENFMPEDYEKDKLPNGREVMALVEQAYIAYAKRLVLGDDIWIEGFKAPGKTYNLAKIAEFMPALDNIIEKYPSYQYPEYFKAKLLLVSGDREHMLESLLPFARKKRNDFWVWEILAEAFKDDEDKVFSCYCKALSCNSPEEMLVSLRQKMAGILISKELFNEAKTEIELLIKARENQGFRLPFAVSNWRKEAWYENAIAQKSNAELYKQHSAKAEALLFNDVPEKSVIVEFVNSDKKILNFIESESRFGFFKYDRFFKNVAVGDLLKVRFQGGSNEGMHQIYTAVKDNDDSHKGEFVKEIAGEVRQQEGKSFGFVGDIYIHPTLMKSLKLQDGTSIKRKAIKTFNKDKKQWGWKVI